MNKTEATLVLFDIDGTLVDTAGAGRIALEQAFGEVFAVDIRAGRTRSVPFAGKTDLSIVRGLGRALGLEPESVEAKLGKLQERYLSALEQELARPEPRRRVLPGVRNLLHALQRAPVHMGLITGNTEGGARRKLGAFDLNAFFPGGGFGTHTEDRREVARQAHDHMTTVARLDFAPERVTVVGDTEDDVSCARSNGFRAIAVRTGWAAPGSLEAAEPDELLDDLTDTDAFIERLDLG